MSYTAYQKATKIAEDPRSVEYRAFIGVTAALERHADDGRITSGLAAALHANTTLWNTLSADLIDDGNQLPAPLKASLISLSIWVLRHTHQVLSAAGKVQPLIDVNRSIIKGLEPRRDQPMQEAAGRGAEVKA